MSPIPAGASELNTPNKKPTFIKGDISKQSYDGVSDDLLSAGLGKDGLAGAPPTFADSDNPTVAELRRLAIYNNYRALVDMAPGGGYGTLYGPNVKADGTDGQGLIAGDEYLAFADNGTGKQNVTLMVQVPASFDSGDACIVTAPSSGSRGVYGAIGTAGDWGLKHGCAVAYTDKGTGTGAHNLATDTVNLIDGRREDAGTAGKRSNFTAGANDNKRQAYNGAFPNRFAFKHAHSRRNPEKLWGKNVLQSIEFAFYVLNEKFGVSGPDGEKLKTIVSENTLVIASSVSNGGGSSVLAAEQDVKNLIDGVAVSEPNVNPMFDGRFSIVQEGRAPVFEHSRNLYDYTSLVNVYQGCANRAPDNLGAPFNFVPAELGENACSALHQKGLLQSATLEDQAIEAQEIINDYGILPEQNILQPSHWFVNVPPGITVTYANAYGRGSVIDNLCGYSFGATDGGGSPMALGSGAEAALFGTSNGIPPTGGVNLINNDSVGGPRKNDVSISPSSGLADQNLDGALCLRQFAHGIDPVTGERVTGPARGWYGRVRAGIQKIRARGTLRGKPAIFVTGRSDAILPLNHTSRAYYGLNRLVDGENSQLRYYEVTNAHHLDAFNAFGGFDERFLPLHHYFIQALDLMYDHLKNSTPLPPSQVIHAVPRGPGAPTITLANLPPVESDPPADMRILFVDNELRIPE